MSISRPACLRRPVSRAAVLASAAACFLVPASVAGAATVTAAPAAHDIVSEVAFPVAISGVADGPSTLSVGWADLTDGCYSPVASDDVLSDLPVSGRFAFEQPGLVEAPGQRLLCAFVEDAATTPWRRPWSRSPRALRGQTSS